MEGFCPQCRVRLDLPSSGVYRCERCRTQFEVALGAPSPPPVTAPQGTAPAYGASGFLSGPAGTGAPAAYGTGWPDPIPTSPTLHAPCVAHPENPAAGVCERCGDFMCRLCATMVEGRVYCPKCFDLLYTRGALQFAQRQFTLPSSTFGLGLSAFVTALSVCLFFISLPLGIGGLVVGFMALKQHRERPDLPNRKLTVAGITCSVVSLLVNAGVVGWLVYSAMSNK